MRNNIDDSYSRGSKGKQQTNQDYNDPAQMKKGKKSY